MNPNSLGEAAYRAFSAARPDCNFPSWESVGIDMKNAWEEAAHAAVDAAGDQTRPLARTKWT